MHAYRTYSTVGPREKRSKNARRASCRPRWFLPPDRSSNIEIIQGAIMPDECAGNTGARRTEYLPVDKPPRQWVVHVWVCKPMVDKFDWLSRQTDFSGSLSWCSIWARECLSCTPNQSMMGECGLMQDYGIPVTVATRAVATGACTCHLCGSIVIIQSPQARKPLDGMCVYAGDGQTYLVRVDSMS